MKILGCMSMITFLFTRLPILIVYFIQFMYQMYLVLYICFKYIILYGVILLSIYIIYKINSLIVIIKSIIKNYDKIKELINSS
jgi:hypothetical protein